MTQFHLINVTDGSVYEKKAPMTILKTKRDDTASTRQRGQQVPPNVGTCLPHYMRNTEDVISRN
jgi:hypothetical protein